MKELLKLYQNPSEIWFKILKLYLSLMTVLSSTFSLLQNKMSFMVARLVEASRLHSLQIPFAIVTILVFVAFCSVALSMS